MTQCRNWRQIGSLGVWSRYHWKSNIQRIIPRLPSVSIIGFERYPNRYQGKTPKKNANVNSYFQTTVLILFSPLGDQLNDLSASLSLSGVATSINLSLCLDKPQFIHVSSIQTSWLSHTNPPQKMNYT